MPLVAFTLPPTQGVGAVTMFGEWDGNEDEDILQVYFQWSYVPPGGFGSQTNPDFSDAVSGAYNKTVGVDPDVIVQYRARVCGPYCVNGQSSGQFRTYANEPSAANPIITNITLNSADASCTFNAAVENSNFVVTLQYRKFGDPNWAEFGSPVTSGSSISASLTGLLSSTLYEVRLHGERTTANTTTWDSAIVNFTTLASAPLLIQTDPASSVSEIQANLNGTVDPNTIAVRVRFGWGTSDGGAAPGSWTNLTAYQNFSGSGNQTFQEAITGLIQLTTYFFRAFVEWPSPDFGNGNSGVTLSFVTPGTPPPPSVGWEDQMHLPQYDAHYGVQTDIYFTLQSPSATSNDRFVTGTVASLGLNIAGDIKISKDGGALVNATNIPTQVTAGGGLYKLVLTAVEVQAELTLVQILDTDGPQFRDLYILVRTKERLGQQIIDAAALGGSAAAVTWKPATGGYALDAQDGSGTPNIGKIRGFLENMSLRANVLQAGGASQATLDASASATDDYYNGDVLMLVGGTGVGQSRVITDYTGGTKVATVGSSWSVNPDSTTRYVIMPGARTLDSALLELASIPAAGANAGLKLQFCFQRFAFKITQTATAQRMYKADSSTELGTGRTVSDDGTTQVVGKI